MITTEELMKAMENLPEKELERVKLRADELIRSKKPNPPPKRGERIRALAGRFDLGECLIPNPDSELLYGDD